MEEEINSRFILFSPWTLLFIFIIFVIGNLFIINIALFWNSDDKTSSQKVSVKTLSPQAKVSPTITPSDCGPDCQAYIKKVISEQLVKPIVKTSTATSIKESFITLGSGSSTNDTWTDVAGIQSYIDSNAYGKIKTVTFEVSLHTPTGNQTAYARLYNVTDAHPVWNSDVSIEGGTAQLKISQPITLGSGSKLYQVQMKTQLSARTNIENSRVHIISN